MLEGTRDLAALTRALDAQVEEVAGALERMASVGLLLDERLAQP